MTPAEFKQALARVGLSHRGAGRFLDVNETTIRRRLAGKARIPEGDAKLLRLMVRLNLSTDDVA